MKQAWEGGLGQHQVAACHDNPHLPERRQQLWSFCHAGDFLQAAVAIIKIYRMKGKVFSDHVHSSGLPRHSKAFSHQDFQKMSS